MHRPPLGIDHRGIAIDQLRHRPPAAGFRRLQSLHLPSDFVHIPDIVLIGRQDIVGPLMPCLLQEPGKVPHGAPPQAIVLGDGDPLVLFGCVVQDLPRGVRAAVVADEQGPVAVRLGPKAVQHFGQVVLTLVGGQYNMNTGRGHGLHST